MNSRSKGKAGELELAKILREHGYQSRRGQQYCGTAGDADVIGLPGIHIEVKRVEKLNIEKAMEQSRSDARQGEIPIVAHRRNRRSWLVTMDLEDFLELYEQAVLYGGWKRERKDVDHRSGCKSHRHV